MNYRKAISFLLLIATIKLLISCVKTETRFEKLSSDKTGIGFSNLISEELTSDILDFFFFSGAGVAIGDINNDGLKDVYFSGNLVSGKLYLNKGNLEFVYNSKKYLVPCERRFEIDANSIVIGFVSNGCF